MTPDDKRGWTYAWSTPGHYSSARHYHIARFYADHKQVGQLTFQDGPVQEHGYNGTTNEQVIEALIERLEALNQQPYQSQYNDRAIAYLKQALAELNARTKSRQEAGKEGNSIP